jgi:hypothetical protein
MRPTNESRYSAEPRAIHRFPGLRNAAEDGQRRALEMKMFRSSLLVAGMLFWAANVPGMAQDFKPYAGAKLDEKASREASAAAPGKQSEVYTTADAFDKVHAFYKGQYKEVPMSRPPPKIAGQQVKWAFFILDGGTSLADSRFWMKIQWPYIGRADGKDFRDVTVIQTVRTK